MEEELRDVVEIVREARVKQGLSFAELGRRAGLSRQFLLNVERGRRDLGGRSLEMVARALGLNVREMKRLEHWNKLERFAKKT